MSATRPVVKIACVMPHSSPAFGARARTQSQAAHLALEEARAAHRLSGEVEVVDEDDAYDREQTAAIARRLAADSHVVAVIGPPSTEMSLFSAPIYADSGLAHIATAATNPMLTRHGWRTFFRMVANDTQHCGDAAAFAVRWLGARRIAVIQDDSIWARDLAGGFRSAVLALDAEIPAFIEVAERGDQNYDETVQTLAAARPDLIFFALHESIAVPLAPQLRKAGLMVPFFAPNALKPFPYIATPDYQVDGPYYTNVTADHRVKEAVGAMVGRYVARYGEEPSLYVAEAYDAMGIILDALRRLGPTPPTRAAALAAIASTREFQGISGTITFDPYGDIVNREIGIYKIVGTERRFLGFTKDLLAGAAARRMISASDASAQALRG